MARRLTTNQEIAGSIPASINIHLLSRALQLLQPLGLLCFLHCMSKALSYVPCVHKEMLWFLEAELLQLRPVSHFDPGY